MAPKAQEVGEARATRKRDACQAEIAAAAGQSKKPGDGKPNYLDRMKLATAGATKKTPQKIPSPAALLATTTEQRLLPPPAMLETRSTLKTSLDHRPWIRDRTADPAWRPNSHPYVGNNQI